MADSIGKQFLSVDHGRNYTQSGVQNWSPSVSVSSVSHTVVHSSLTLGEVLLARDVESYGGLSSLEIAAAFTWYRLGSAMTKSGPEVGAITGNLISIQQSYSTADNWQADRVVFDGASGNIITVNGATLQAFDTTIPSIAPFVVTSVADGWDGGAYIFTIRFSTPIVSGPFDETDFVGAGEGPPETVTIDGDFLSLEWAEGVSDEENPPATITYTKNVPYFDDFGSEVPSFVAVTDS